MPPSFRRILRAPIAWILLFAAALRLAFFLQVRGEPAFAVPLWDAAIYDEMARSLARGNGIGFERAYFFGPLYAYALGLVYALTGSCLRCAILLQHGLGILLCGLTCALGARWLGRREGLLAAALMAALGVQLFYEGHLLMEVLLSVLLAGHALLLLRAEGAAGSRAALGAGLLLGLAATGRPSVIVLAALVLVPALRTSGRAGRARARLVTLYVLGVLAAPGAATVRNAVTEGVFVPITSSGGFNFFVGNSRDSNGMFLDDEQVKADVSWNGEETAETALGRDLDSAEVSRYWYRRALAEIRADPRRWLGLYFRKVRILLNAQDPPQIEWFSFERGRFPILRALPDLRLPMAAALAGAIALLPRAGRLAGLYGVVTLYVAGIAAAFVTSRYRVAVLPYLCVFAAGFGVLLADAVRRRQGVRLAALAAAAVLAWTFTSPSRFPLDVRAATYAQHLRDGFRLRKLEKTDRALDAYRRAAALWPEDYESYLGLGIAYREMGDLPASLAALEAALARNASDADVPYQRAVTLHKLGRDDEAERALRRSLSMSPRRAATHAYLGLILAATGRFEEARSAFEASLRLDPHEPFTYNNLGVLLGRLGDRAGARRHFLRALREDPGYTTARCNLAQACLDDGDVASATRELRTVLRQKPDDPEATALLSTLRGAVAR